MTRTLYRLIPLSLLGAVVLHGCAGGPVDNAGLKSANPDVRRERVIQLGRQRPFSPDARKQLVDALTALGQSDADPLVRSAALSSLQKQDAAAAEGLALQLAIDPDPMVRTDAMNVLALNTDPRSRSALLYAVRNDGSSDVRRRAARGLANFDDDEVVRLLIELLADSDPGVVVASCRSLQRISGLKLGTHSTEWQTWLDARAGVPAPSSESQPALAPQSPDVPAQPPIAGPPPVSPQPPPVVVKEAPVSVPAPSPTIDVDELRRNRR